jgi:hypothetical protein
MAVALFLEAHARVLRINVCLEKDSQACIVYLAVWEGVIVESELTDSPIDRGPPPHGDVASALDPRIYVEQTFEPRCFAPNLFVRAPIEERALRRQSIDCVLCVPPLVALLWVLTGVCRVLQLDLWRFKNATRVCS